MEISVRVYVSARLCCAAFCFLSCGVFVFSFTCEQLNQLRLFCYFNGNFGSSLRFRPIVLCCVLLPLLRCLRLQLHMRAIESTASVLLLQWKFRFESTFPPDLLCCVLLPLLRCLRLQLHMRAIESTASVLPMEISVRVYVSARLCCAAFCFLSCGVFVFSFTCEQLNQLRLFCYFNGNFGSSLRFRPIVLCCVLLPLLRCLRLQLHMRAIESTASVLLLQWKFRFESTFPPDCAVLRSASSPAVSSSSASHASN